MKKFLFFAFVLTLFAACNSGSDATEAEVSDAQDAAEATGATYAVSTASSVINWTGRKFGDDQHNGTLSLSEGSLTVADGNITSGSFTIDMASMACTDEMSDDMKAKLIGHLSTGDFFKVDEYPTATFEITGVEVLEGDETATHSVSGNLTMLDSTNNVTFKATVSADGSSVKATSETFKIDRTLWGVKYGSTLIGTIKDKAIQNDLELTITLEASTGEEGEEATAEEGDGEEVTEEK